MQDQVLQTLEDLKYKATRDREKANKEFNLENLRKEQRREYALSDPHAKKKEAPPNYEDGSLGPSSFVTFAGEGPADKKGFKKALQQKQREALLEQLRDQEERARAEREEEQRFDDAALMAAQVQAHVEHIDQEERRQERLQDAEENRQLADFHSRRRQSRAERDADETARHMENVRNSDRLNEKTDWQVAPNGKLLDYRRLSQDEEQQAYDLIARQIQDKEAMRLAELAEEQEHANAVDTQVSVLSTLEAERSQQQKSRRQRMNEENMLMAARKHELDAEDRRKYRSFEYEP